MSHIISIKTEIRDPVALKSACFRLPLPQPSYENVQLFSDTATGWAVRLPHWRYPVVCDIEQRQVHFDNFGGRWGDQKELDKLLQRYAVEKTYLEARRQGHSIQERTLADGSVQLTVEVGGAS